MSWRMRDVVLLGSALLLATVLVISSVRTRATLEEQRSAYLRSRAGALAAQLETLEPRMIQEPGLIDLRILDRASTPPEAQAIWDGTELFRTQEVVVRGEPALRAWIPFEAQQGLRLARMDFAYSAADFLVSAAWRQIAVASVAALALIGLSGYAVWSLRRAAQLEHLAQIGQMSAVLAHEIRNPLGTIKGYAQLSLERASDADKEFLRPILSETARLENLVRDLLLYGRPPHVEKRAVPWSEIRTAMRGHARAVRFVTDDRDFVLHTDPALLQQALLNLVRNAVEAIPEDREGEVRLEAERHRGSLRIAVRDNGTGISPEAARRLFTPFHTTKAFGTGLGLAVTKKLAESLGGSVSLSPREGGGTEAAITLPYTGDH